MTITLSKRPSPADVQAAADIERMHAIISLNGWIPDAYYDRVQVTVANVTPAQARVDMYGALHIVLCDSPVPRDVLAPNRQQRHLAVVKAVGSYLDTIGFYFWQHDPDRTQDDVLAALKGTADRLLGGAS